MADFHFAPSWNIVRRTNRCNTSAQLIEFRKLIWFYLTRGTRFYCKMNADVQHYIWVDKNSSSRYMWLDMWLFACETINMYMSTVYLIGQRACSATAERRGFKCVCVLFCQRTWTPLWPRTGVWLCRGLFASKRNRSRVLTNVAYACRCLEGQTSK